MGEMGVIQGGNTKVLGEYAIIGMDGDTKVIWDPDKKEEVDNARETFDRLVKKGKYAAFAVKKDGSQGSRIRDFDPKEEKLIFVPPMAGG